MSPATFHNIPEALHRFKITPRGCQRNRLPLRFNFHVGTPTVDYCDVRAQAVPVGEGGVNVTLIFSDPSVRTLTCILDGMRWPTCQSSWSNATNVTIACLVLVFLYCRLLPIAYNCGIRWAQASDCGSLLSKEVHQGWDSGVHYLRINLYALFIG